MEVTTYKIYNLPTHSYLAVIGVSPTGNEDPAVFVVKDEVEDVGSSSEESSTPGVGSSEEESSSDSSAEELVVYPHRVLISVASLTDIDYYGLTPAVPGALYRAANVSMIFRSQQHMEDVLSRLMSQLRILADLQRLTIEDTVMELYDPAYGKDPNTIYYFR